MSTDSLGSLTLALLLLVAAASALGHLAVRLRQPKVVGEILAGILLGPPVPTSQACGAWLDFVLRKGWPLLSTEGAVQPRRSELGAAHAPVRPS